ncbi:MAG: hypothetical protein OEV91_03105 [Desulfobulbaceae bacterium]|nr:hypothetical protein [Desulfobulbaceae bacterium]
MKKRSYLQGLCLTVLAGSCLLALGNSELRAAEPSGCVVCHLDQAKIVANFAKVEVKTSAKQAGTG